MSLANREPNTIMLSTGGRVDARTGMGVEIGGRLGVAATPGMLVEEYEVTNELKWRPNASATELMQPAVLVDKPFEVGNTGIDDEAAINENAHVVHLQNGDVFYSKLVSGQAAAIGALLQPNGNGWLKAATATTADANLGRFRALQELNGGSAVTADTRLRVRFLG